MDTFVVDYTKIDEKSRRTVAAIESKPHVRYIRYLMTKRYSPISIKRELFRLGLSAPHEPNLIAYYLCVIDPVVKQMGLGQLYADYKNKLLKKGKRGEFSKDILNYRLHLGDKLDDQVKFLRFAVCLEVDDVWSKEIYRFYGTATSIPLDENGNKIIDISSPNKNAEKILINPKRYLIDKMILENVPDSRIAKYCRETLKIVLNDYDVHAYKQTFFNLKVQTIEERIKALEVEKNSLNALLSDINNSDYELDLGERMLIEKQTEQRITELDDNIKTLNMMYSEFAFSKALGDQHDFKKIFEDIVVRGYQRFVQLDGYKDRDVVDPLTKVAKMMAFAHDKVETITSTNGANGGNTDRHSAQELMELYKKRTDEILEEEAERANRELAKIGGQPVNRTINANDIAGIEELGVSFEVNQEE
jgi:hypothetical protein